MPEARAEEPGRILALDVGDRRIGVALSDPTGLLATPLTTISRGRSDTQTVLGLAAEHDVTEIIVGLPLTLAGRRGEQAERVADFAEALSDRADVPVRHVDERYSSVQAERLLSQSGVSPSRNRPRVDAVAAAVILQSYLDSRRDAV